jgi:hypothetical protein
MMEKVRLEYMNCDIGIPDLFGGRSVPRLKVRWMASINSFARNRFTARMCCGGGVCVCVKGGGGRLMKNYFV